jgi:hypothetical protein
MDTYPHMDARASRLFADALAYPRLHVEMHVHAKFTFRIYVYVFMRM